MISAAQKIVDRVTGELPQHQRENVRDEIWNTGSAVLVLDANGKFYRFGLPVPGSVELSDKERREKAK